MSAATSFSPPPAQFPSGSEHLSVHTLMESMNSQQSLPSAVESIDEVQLGLEAQVDEESTGDGHESDQLDADPITTSSVATDNHPSIEELGDDRAQLEQVFEFLNPTYEQGIGANAVATGSAPLALESNTTQTLMDGASDTFISNSTHTTILDSTPIASAPVDDAINQEGNGSTNPVETAAFGSPLLDEHDMAALAHSLVPGLEVEAETNLSEVDLAQNNAQGEPSYPSQTSPSSQPGLSTAQSTAPEVHEGEEMSHVGVEPLRRMDNETIPVTEHSKDTIIGILNDAPPTSVDESIQSVIAQEETMTEGDSTAIASNSALEPSQGDTASDGPMEREPAEIITNLDPIQEPTTEADGDIAMEPEHAQDLEGDDVEMDELASTVGEEPTSAVDIEQTIVVETNETVSDDTDYVLVDASETEATPIIEQVTTTIQATTVEEVEPALESDGPEATLVPEITVTDMDIVTTAITTTAITVETDSTSQFTSAPEEGIMEMEQIHRAAQIQQEQDATTERLTDDNPDAPTDDSPLATGVAPGEEIPHTPDEAAPKDSGEPLRSRPETESGPTEIEPVVETVESIDPLITQNEEAAPEPLESFDESGPQGETLEQELLTEETSNRFTPDWDALPPADEGEDAPGSPEVTKPSSKASQRPDSGIASPTANPAGSSAGEAPDADLVVDDLAAPTTSHQPNRKRRMIMEVVIPVPTIKSETTRSETARGLSKPKPQASAPLSSPPKAGPSSDRRPSSPSASSVTGSPLPSEDEGKGESPTQSASRSRQPRRGSKKPFGSRKQTLKKSGKKHTPVVHAARSLKVEVVMSKAARPRHSLLRRTGSIPSGNNVKFAPISPVTGKRKAEAEPEPEPEPEEQVQTEEAGSDVDAEGEDDEGYEDVEDAQVNVEVPKRRSRKPKASPVKRPRRSNEARKTPAKLPEVLTGSRSPAAKRRRLRR